MAEALAGVALVSALAAGGCGKPVLREPDASLGDYYTAEEFKRLSKEQREEYCRELAEQRETFRSQIAEAEEAIRSLEEEAGPTRTETDSLRAVAADLEAKVLSARGTGGGKRGPGQRGEGAPDRYVVRRGDSLWRISGRRDVYGAPARWKRIYEANKDRIDDPDRIVPGQEIHIPR